MVGWSIFLKTTCSNISKILVYVYTCTLYVLCIVVCVCVCVCVCARVHACVCVIYVSVVFGPRWSGTPLVMFRVVVEADHHSEHRDHLCTVNDQYSSSIL